MRAAWASPLSSIVLLAAVAGCGSSGSSGSSGSTKAGPASDAGGICATCPDSTAATDGGTDGASSGRPDMPLGGGDATAAEGGAIIGDPTGTMATPAATFLGSIGVCVHIAQGVDSAPQVATALSYAGIRNLRDDGRPTAVADWITVHQQAGTLVDMLPNSDLETTLDMAKQLRDAGALLSVEGPNEPNNFPVTYDGGTSSSTTFLPVADFQRDLYAAVHGEPTLAGIPVFHSSEAGGSEPDDVGLQFLAIPADAGTTMPAGTLYADFANTHNYVCGHSQQLVDNVCWNASDPTLDGDWDGLYVEYGHTWNRGFAGYADTALSTLPRVTTETGWLTTGTGAITQEQQARIFLNLYLSAYKRGWSYTFIYMLRDDPSQGYWGLFDTSYQPKTSGAYVHNMTTLLSDATARSPGRLAYTVSPEPSTVHDLLLQKSSGVFELAVWDEHPGGGSDAVVVDLGSARPTVDVYDPTMGSSPLQTMTAVRTVSLTLTDHPVILEVSVGP